MKQQADSKWRSCYKAEHVKHIVLGCTTLTPSEYTYRHNKVAGYIHWTIRKLMGLQVTDQYYEHITVRVINVKGTAIMWDVPVIRDRKILANRTDIVPHDKKKNISILIDIVISRDSNFNTKETEKLKK